MSNIKLFTALAVLLSLGLGTACQPPQPAFDAAAAEAEAKKVAEEEEAVKKAAEEEAARLRAEQEAEAARLREEEEARRREAERLAAEAREAMRQASEGVLVDVNFDYNRSDVRRADRLKLQAIAEFMKAFPEASVRVEGHCDERGTIEYNMALGERRAFAVKEYLVNLGVNDARLTTISFGKEIPKVTGSSEKSWFANRRSEFKLQ